MALVFPVRRLERLNRLHPIYLQGLAMREVVHTRRVYKINHVELQTIKTADDGKKI